MADITKLAQPTTRSATEDDEFTLNAAQMQFMINAHNAAEAAYATQEWGVIDEITASNEWRQLFGDMSWDQAYDRYEIMMGFCTAIRLSILSVNWNWVRRWWEYSNNVIRPSDPQQSSRRNFGLKKRQYRFKFHLCARLQTE